MVNMKAARIIFHTDKRLNVAGFGKLICSVSLLNVPQSPSTMASLEIIQGHTLTRDVSSTSAESIEGIDNRQRTYCISPQNSNIY